MRIRRKLLTGWQRCITDKSFLRKQFLSIFASSEDKWATSGQLRSEKYENRWHAQGEGQRPNSSGVDELNIGGWVLMPLPSSAGQYLICPRCGSQVFTNSTYCNFCGTLLRPQLVLKICPNCKSKISISARFCPECGRKQRSTLA